MPHKSARRKGAAAGGIVPGAEGLGNQRVHAQQHAGATNGDGEEEHAAERACADRGRAQAAGHDGIDKAHRHPAQLSEREGWGQAQHRPDVLAEAGDHFLNDPVLDDHALGCALS